MRKRLRIPMSLVEEYYNDANFLVDTNNTFVYAIKLGKAWLKPFGYEIDRNDV